MSLSPLPEGSTALGAVSYPALATLGILCLYAVWSDVRWRKLPNWLCAATFAAGAFLSVWDKGLLPFAESNLVHALSALIVGMILFRLGLFGGGDAKFYAAIAAWFPLPLALALMIDTALAGLIAAIFWLLARRIFGKKVGRNDDSALAKFPFGIAIALGAIAALLQTQA